MKATLEFNLPEDDHEFRVASSAQELASALWDVEQLLRSAVKYGRDPLATIQECRSRIAEIRDKLE